MLDHGAAGGTKRFARLADEIIRPMRRDLYRRATLLRLLVSNSKESSTPRNAQRLRNRALGSRFKSSKSTILICSRSKRSR